MVIYYYYVARNSYIMLKNKKFVFYKFAIIKELKILNFFSYFIFLIFFSLNTTENFGKDKYSIKDLTKLIKTNKCDRCNLESADLINMDLSNAKITNSNLKNANLSGGFFDNVDFYGTDLSGSSLKNTSIRNANLIKTKLEETDFRYSDITNSKFDFEGLSKSIWSYSVGLRSEHDNFQNFYNSGVKHYLKKDYIYAIKLFSLAITKNPSSIESYLSRAIINFNLDRDEECLADLKRSNELMIGTGNIEYQDTVTYLSAVVYEKNKEVNNIAGNIFRTIIQGYSLFRFL